ncbi:hypothetical protein HQ520_00230 [bacterium]|nr:hypothetical protein [bacterium]
MSRFLIISMLMAVAALGMTAPLAAQADQTRSAVSVADLDAAVAEKPSAVRKAVQEFLTTDGAQKFADGMGMSLTELSAQVAGLDEESLNGLAEQAGISGETLAGGAETIVLTSTTVIIILLLILLLA